MVRRIFEKESRIQAPAQKVFDWHKTDDALTKLIPPSDPVEVASRSGGIEDGATVTLRISFLGLFGMDWVAHHQNYIEGEQFEDVQVRGPFHHWVHTHSVKPLSDQECILQDHVEYELPFGRIGDFFGNWLVRRKLKSMFNYRHDITRQELEE